MKFYSRARIVASSYSSLFFRLRSPLKVLLYPVDAALTPHLLLSSGYGWFQAPEETSLIECGDQHPNGYLRDTVLGRESMEQGFRARVRFSVKKVWNCA